MEGFIAVCAIYKRDVQSLNLRLHEATGCRKTQAPQGQKPGVTALLHITSAGVDLHSRSNCMRLLHVWWCIPCGCAEELEGLCFPLVAAQELLIVTCCSQPAADSQTLEWCTTDK
jgi:hypothetical protein